MQDLRLDWIIAEVKDMCGGVNPESETLPDGTGGGGRETWRNIADIAFERALKEKRQNWTLILDSLISKALAETNPELLRNDLIFVAATAIMWAVKLDSESQILEVEE